MQMSLLNVSHLFALPGDLDFGCMNGCIKVGALVTRQQAFLEYRCEDACLASAWIPTVP